MAKRPVGNGHSKGAVAFPTSESLGNQIRIASRLYDRAIANRLKAFGIPYGVWGFLRQLWQEDGQQQFDLAASLDLSGSTTVTAIDRMEKLGLISRERSSSDRRNVHINLTRKGKALEAQLLPVAVEVNDLSVADVKRQDLDVFRKVLRSIHDSLRKDEVQLALNSRRKKLRTELRTLE